jgi:hypothetical protein
MPEIMSRPPRHDIKSLFQVEAFGLLQLERQRRRTRFEALTPPAGTGIWYRCMVPYLVAVHGTGTWHQWLVPLEQDISRVSHFFGIRPYWRLQSEDRLVEATGREG